MTDPLSTVNGITSLVQTTLLATKFYFSLRSYSRAIISQTYGGTAGFFISTFFGNTASEYERLQRVVIRGNDEEALRFRDSVTNECNMTAIAVSGSRLPGLTYLSPYNWSVG